MKTPHNEQLETVTARGSRSLADTGDAVHALYNSLKERNRALGSPFYEGVVMKRANSPYPIQLRSDSEEFRGWVKHRFLR